MLVGISDRQRELQLTASNFVYLVLKEEVGQRYQCAEETITSYLPILDRLWIGRAKHDAANCPRYCSNEVRNHKDVVHVVVIGRCDVGPSSACEGAEDAHARDELGQRATTA